MMEEVQKENISRRESNSTDDFDRSLDWWAPIAFRGAYSMVKKHLYNSKFTNPSIYQHFEMAEILNCWLLLVATSYTTSIQGLTEIPAEAIENGKEAGVNALDASKNQLSVFPAVKCICNFIFSLWSMRW